jgi:GNAT superfamily N-acetyltransferase
MANNNLLIRNMNRAEVDQLVGWAAREGWNPGLHDADVFWATDPGAFIAADLDAELIGGGAITAYDGVFGFMGFFIVRPEFRGRGLGNTLWQARRERLIARLHPGATIGMDGVFGMQAYYAQGGFVFAHRDLRYRAEIPAGPLDLPTPDAGVIPLADVPFDELLAYDRTCFPALRPAFLKAWTAQPDALALGFRRDGALRGYGVVRRCREGCKVGPLFADDGATANTIYAHLSRFAAGGPLFLDVPENNPDAMALARRHGMTEVFGCARMYLGPAPALAHERIFGVTTFELG